MHKSKSKKVVSTLRACADAAWAAGWNATRVSEPAEGAGQFVATFERERLEIARKGDVYTVQRFDAGAATGAPIVTNAAGARAAAELSPPSARKEACA